MSRYVSRYLGLMVAVGSLFPSLAAAQTSSLYLRSRAAVRPVGGPSAMAAQPPEGLPAPQPNPAQPSLPPTAISATRSYINLPPPRRIRVHDIVGVRVDVASRMLSEGSAQRRKNASYNATLLDWIFLSNLSVRPSPQSDGDPTVAGSVTQLYRAEGDLESRESLAFNIAATVVDIRNNGTLVLEAHRTIRNNNEAWEYSLSGLCRPEDVGPDNVVLSRDIVQLDVVKRERGHVRDAYRRGWLQRGLDLLNPF